MKPTTAQIKQKLSELTGELKDYLISDELAEKCLEVSKKNSLHIDQTGILNSIIGDVIIGASSMKSFLPRVMEEIRVSADQANAIAEDVNEEIFKPVRDSLRKMEAEMNTGAVEEVHLSREDLLHQLENPVPTPFSGRRTESGEARFMIQDSRMDGNSGDSRFMIQDSGIISDMNTKTDDAVAAEMQKAFDNEAEQGTPVAINKPASTNQPQSILEKKLNSVTVTNKNTLPVDPYREVAG